MNQYLHRQKKTLWKQRYNEKDIDGLTASTSYHSRTVSNVKDRKFFFLHENLFIKNNVVIVENKNDKSRDGTKDCWIYLTSQINKDCILLTRAPEDGIYKCLHNIEDLKEDAIDVKDDDIFMQEDSKEQKNNHSVVSIRKMRTL